MDFFKSFFSNYLRSLSWQARLPGVSGNGWRRQYREVVARGGERLDSPIEILLLHQHVIGVVSREREEAHAGRGEGLSERGQDAGEGEIQNALHLEHAPTGHLLRTFGNRGLGADHR